ncbi:tRNA (cytosine(32)/uridine(32)-2'-O)-methyltransferase TrmJ [Testudinibacter sp. TR-2022]|uniref:tRNA (cytosine(32)/uridine(32)-2'-O)-methyltransferase TrmJ n=1 Tax=Testudinibacter sp. TR-2022 TaxID=2585029 RepID=UPI00111821CF|nr:tRNA (cytosine(32)/uridine(32)-2'-O)-methyltransferase TrmJ [Pasteurellaceae bacterium Phil11]TNH22103.1 tRNA (cytosine(32)/uridine(32)-2'-O)-methyltransferase TrmJ [Testudinibacter sp. TR-2022]TNH26581.1 tRNA (cytosine(32)/uridine(32)-2'-O)-methyltransferase TrmJ [Testudinibacter sp. TR-2022]
MQIQLKNIRIVLVETSHTGNIGSTARAMKTMGLSSLYLVAPKTLPDEQAIALSAGANDIVESAVVVENFNQAVADCSLVIGTSARSRHLAIPQIDPRGCGKQAVRYAEQGGKVAIVFGRERVGLTNEELLKCGFHLNIPANPDYASLNLAMAVQLVSYEIRMAMLGSRQSEPTTLVTEVNEKPTQQELDYFFNQTEQLYRQLNFIQNSGVMPKLRSLYARADLRKNELNILQGMLAAVKKSTVASE